MFVIVIYTALMLLLLIVRISRLSKERARDEKLLEPDRRYYEINLKYARKGLDAKTYEEAKACLDVLEKNYPGDEAILNPLSREVYHEDMRDLKWATNALKKNEKQQWEGEAGWALDLFFKYYNLVVHCDLDSVAHIHKNKEKCLQYWDKYFSIPIPNSTINAQSYMRKSKEYIEADMKNRETLCGKLDRSIEESKELSRIRKYGFSKLRGEIRQSGGRIARSALLSKQYEGLTEKEIKTLYAQMKKNRSLIEEKQGNRYYVSERK